MQTRRGEALARSAAGWQNYQRALWLFEASPLLLGTCMRCSPATRADERRGGLAAHRGERRRSKVSALLRKMSLPERSRQAAKRLQLHAVEVLPAALRDMMFCCKFSFVFAPMLAHAFVWHWNSSACQEALQRASSCMPAVEGFSLYSKYSKGYAKSKRPSEL